MSGIVGFETSKSPLNILNQLNELNGENLTLKNKLTLTQEFLTKKEIEAKSLLGRNGNIAAENQQLRARIEIYEQQQQQQQPLDFCPNCRNAQDR